MKEALDLASKSGIHRLITALEERGFIRRLPNRARALEVLRLPESDCARASAPQRQILAERHRGRPSAGREAARGRAAGNDDGVSAPVSIPVMGRIAAGVPISAIQHKTHSIAVPPEMLVRRRALRAGSQGRFDDRGRHFRRRHGHHPKCQHRQSGEIVVALVDEEEATLKRFRRKGASIALEAANPAYETRIFGPDRVKSAGQAGRA